MSPRKGDGPDVEAALQRVDVLDVDDVGCEAIRALTTRYGLALQRGPAARVIPASYWGGREAGLRGRTLHVRGDTPVHSALHELAHFICMDAARRRSLDCDAGGDFAEEDAVCYLQILLADQAGGMDRERMCRDMDTWGYTFRLGSARAWFDGDAEDAAAWLHRSGIIDAAGRPTGCCRDGCNHAGIAT